MAVFDIEKLERNMPSTVKGIFRICDPKDKITQGHTPYQCMTLMNITGRISGFVWPNRYYGTYEPKNNDIVHIIGKPKIIPQKNVPAIDLYDVEPAKFAVNPFECLPPESVADKDEVRKLIDIMESITSRSLKAFIYEVFSEDQLAKSFVNCKGSYDHHHSEKGGLLSHSLEMVSFVNRMSELPVHEREIGMVAALLHDISKTKLSYNATGPNSPMLKHDTRTLEMLAVPLQTLENAWSDGAGLLRNILEYPLTTREYMSRRMHVPSIANLVWWADQFSTSTYKERKEYARMGKLQRYSKSRNETFFRIRPECH